ncbi:hypothetical protein Aduo_002369 [Ancylostoma duodenale]
MPHSAAPRVNRTHEVPDAEFAEGNIITSRCQERTGMRNRGFEVSQPKGLSCREILLRCDQLWDIKSGSMIKLRSGLHLIATKFEYMISQKQSNGDAEDTTLLAVATEKEERERWDRLWTLDTRTLEIAELQIYTGTLKD